MPPSRRRFCVSGRGDGPLAANQVLERHGLGMDAIVSKHYKPLLAAKKTVLFSSRGAVTDERKVPDNETRRWAVEQGLKMHGAYSKDSAEDGAESGGFRIAFNPLTPESARNLLELLERREESTAPDARQPEASGPVEADESA
jgi:hypothetical protein